MTALLLAACCAGARAQAAPAAVADFDELIIDQTACLFDCPVFELAVFSDGRVRHSGPTFETSGGAHESRIDARALERITQAVRAARLDKMRGTYQDKADGCEFWVTDMSTLIVRVNRARGAQSDVVVLYAGCAGPAIPTGRINALFKAVDGVTGTNALLAQRMQARRPKGAGAGQAK